ncbi:flagellar biosynthetic protein FliP [bacterium]|nr:MAG: flagellar biosynthetic protein FliP [bacterium]RIK61158.1 MAG: flagellar biosynthetic protein FliP [Planctomycetota bacterium]
MKPRRFTRIFLEPSARQLRDYSARVLGRFLPFWLFVAAAALVIFFAGAAQAQEPMVVKPTFIERAESFEDTTAALELMVLLTVLTLAPSILILTTAFTRIVIVMSFVRRALGTQELPPNQLLIGLSLMLTFMVMRPTFMEIKDRAFVPYQNGEITQQEFLQRAEQSMRNFMFTHVSPRDLKQFKELSEDPAHPQTWETYGDVDTLVLVPAFVTSELKRGFYMGFILYLPFLIIDLVVSTVLIAMGMLVLPPVLISLPFKLLLFVMVDGWNLVILGLARSFQVAPSL